MATATSRPPHRPGPLAAAAPRSATLARVLALCHAVYKFLASVKLAVLCLGALALTLAAGTYFNRNYGLNAANEYIYQSRWFAVLMAFLACNVLCAALIRYPWVKRQTGFLITHVGLLVVIGASWWAARSADEGLLGMIEGQTSNELIRTTRPAVFVRPLDPHTNQVQGTYEIQFRPGAFDWAAGRSEVVSKPDDPFQLAIKGYYACAAPAESVVAAPGGEPMLKLRPTIIPPGGTEPMPVFTNEEDAWFSFAGTKFDRVVRSVGPAQFVVTRAGRPEVFDDFLDPPADPGVEGVARLHYEGTDGKPRRFDVRLDDARAGVDVPLPDSDLVVAFKGLSHLPIESEEQQAKLGTDTLDIVQFLVRRGAAPAVEHNGFAMLPSIPPVIPPSGDADAEPPPPLLRINYYGPPVVDPQVNRKFGVVEVMVDRTGRLAYRVFERGNPGKLRGHGPLQVGETITAFGGTSVTPMTLRFDVERFEPSARREVIARSIELPPNQREEALPAVLAELTVKGVSRDVWLIKSPDFDINYRTVACGDALYQVGFDVDRLQLPFSLTLDDFDVGFDPGTANASSYKSEVTLDHEAAGIKGAKKTISMNNVLDHGGWRFFQTNYQRVRDKRTGRPTGEFMSVFQVAKNPARELIYAGCIIVVLGAFVQFYMRAGVFSDGGKLERERDAAKARRRLEAKSRSAAPDAKPRAPADDEFEPL